MRAAKYILGTIGVLIILAAALHYIREKTLTGYNPVVEVVIGTFVGAYAYNRRMRQESHLGSVEDQHDAQ